MVSEDRTFVVVPIFIDEWRLPEHAVVRWERSTRLATVTCACERTSRSTVWIHFFKSYVTPLASSDSRRDSQGSQSSRLLLGWEQTLRSSPSPTPSTFVRWLCGSRRSSSGFRASQLMADRRASSVPQSI